MNILTKLWTNCPPIQNKKGAEIEHSCSKAHKKTMGDSALYWASESAAKHLWGWHTHTHTPFLGHTQTLSAPVRLTPSASHQVVVREKKSNGQCGPVCLARFRPAKRSQLTPKTFSLKKKKRKKYKKKKTQRYKCTFTGRDDIEYLTQHDPQEHQATGADRRWVTWPKIYITRLFF